MNIFIKNAEIITMDKENPVFSGGNIRISGNKIVYVGKDGVPCESDKIIDARGGIVMPGLINAHTHVPMTLLRGYADDLPLHTWLFEKIFPAEDRLDSDAVYYGAKVAMAEMIKSGTTTFADMYFFSESVAKAAIKAGMNANIARCVTGKEDDYKERLNEARALFDEYNCENDGAVKIDFSVHAIYTCGKQAVRETSRLAKKLGANMHIHLSETMKENGDCYAEYGKSPTEMFNSWGVFENKTNAAHCVYLSENDMNILKEKNVSVSHNPTSNLKLASGVANIKEMQEKGISIAIGTDGTASNNALNMFFDLKLCALLQKGIRLDPTIVSAEDALFMATAGGAEALGRADTGRIKEGNRADIIILDSFAPSLMPVHNPISLAVYSASGAEVKTSIIGGRIVMEDRELKTIDLEEAKAKVNESLKRMKLM